MRFSVIVPVYNAARFLRPCLDSVLDQTCRDWECLCVDDGSTDGSGAILDEYAARDVRFRVIHKSNEGVSVARNVAMDAARGEWLTFLDADDFYASERLAVAEHIIVRENPDLVRFRLSFLAESAIRYEADPGSREQYEVFDGELARQWGWRVLAPVSMPWTYVVRREFLKDSVFPFGMRIKEDSIFAAYFINRLERVVQSEFRAYGYRQCSTSAMHGVRKADDSVRLLKEVKCFLRSPAAVSNDVSPETRIVMKRWLRAHCESDVRDWVTTQVDEGGRNGEILDLYRAVTAKGGLDIPGRMKWFNRLPLKLWRATGWHWPIRLSWRIVRVGVRLLKDFRK